MKLLRDSKGEWMTGFQLTKDCTLQSPIDGNLIDVKAGCWIIRSWHGQAYLLSQEELTARGWEIIE